MTGSAAQSKRSLRAFEIAGDPENSGPPKVARCGRGEASTASFIPPAARTPLGNLGLSSGNSVITRFPAKAVATAAAVFDSGYDSGNYSELSTFLGPASASHDEFEDEFDSGIGLLHSATMEAAKQELPTMEAAEQELLPTMEDVQQELEMSLRPVLGDSDFMLQIKSEIRNSVSRDIEIKNCSFNYSFPSN